jgi:cyclopropane fatty-acyl-phospholipid synthase-like methyltransferase
MQQMVEQVVWHQDDTFWTDIAPFMFGPESWQEVPGQNDAVLERLEIEPGATVLDLACGPGRHSLELARRGFRVTGVDRTETYLEEARKRAKEEGLAIEFFLEDMRSFTRTESFNAAISLFTSFGFFDTAEDNQQVLRNVLASLKKGGSFLIDIVGREILARKFQARDWQEQGGTILLQDRKVIRNWTMMRNRWILIKENSRREFIVTHWLYSAAELAALLSDSGFESVEIYGDLNGAAYDIEASRLVALARK